MLKPFPLICLTAATIPVVGALLWAQSDKPPREVTDQSVRLLERILLAWRPSFINQGNAR